MSVNTRILGLALYFARPRLRACTVNLFWEVFQDSPLFRSGASARVSWMVTVRATRSRSPREAGAQPGSRAESGKTKLSEFRKRNLDLLKFSVKTRVLISNPDFEDSRSFKPSRTVGTDEGRNLPTPTALGCADRISWWTATRSCEPTAPTGRVRSRRVPRFRVAHRAPAGSLRTTL